MPLKPIEYTPPDVLVTQTFDTVTPIIGPTELLSCSIAPLMQIESNMSLGKYDGKLDSTTTFTFSEGTIEIPSLNSFEVTGGDVRNLVPGTFAEDQRVAPGDRIVITDSPNPVVIGNVYTVRPRTVNVDFVRIIVVGGDSTVDVSDGASQLLDLTLGSTTIVPAGSRYRIEHAVAGGVSANETYSLALKTGAIIDSASVRISFKDSVGSFHEIPGPNSPVDITGDTIEDNVPTQDVTAFTLDPVAGMVTITGANDPNQSSVITTGTIDINDLDDIAGTGTLFVTDGSWATGEGLVVGDIFEVTSGNKEGYRFRVTAIPTTFTDTSLSSATAFLEQIEGTPVTFPDVDLVGVSYRLIHNANTILKYTDSFNGNVFVYNRDLTGNELDTAADIVVTYRALRTDYSYPSYRLLEYDNLTTLDEDLGPITPENPLVWHMSKALSNTDTRVTGVAVSRNPSELTVMPQTVTWNNGTVSIPDLTAVNGTGTAFAGVTPEVADRSPEMGDILTVTITPTNVAVFRISAIPSVTATSITPLSGTGNVLELISGNPTFPIVGATYELVQDVQPLNRLAYAEAIEAAGQFDVYSLHVGFPEMFDASVQRYVYDDTMFNPGVDNAAIALINQDLMQHVLEMSLPENKKERIATVINPSFSDSWLLPSNTYPKNEMAADLASYAEGFSQRRLFITLPPYALSDVAEDISYVSGTAVIAAISGMDSYYPPEQGFTNLPMVGFSGVKGSNDFFTPTQLNAIAQDGTYIVVQDGRNTPLYARHQISSDRTQLYKSERSITKQIDFGARIIRRELKPYVGIYNVTPQVIQMTKLVVEASIRFLVDNRHWASGTILVHEQSPVSPDRIRTVIRVVPLSPLNYFDVEFLI